MYLRTIKEIRTSFSKANFCDIPLPPSIYRKSFRQFLSPMLIVTPADKRKPS